VAKGLIKLLLATCLESLDPLTHLTLSNGFIKGYDSLRLLIVCLPFNILSTSDII